jgi:hypothetical protein
MLSQALLKRLGFAMPFQRTQMRRIAWLISIFPNVLKLKYLESNFLANRLRLAGQTANQLYPKVYSGIYFRIECLASARMMDESILGEGRGTMLLRFHCGNVLNLNCFP